MRKKGFSPHPIIDKMREAEGLHITYNFAGKRSDFLHLWMRTMRS